MLSAFPRAAIGAALALALPCLLPCLAAQAQGTPRSMSDCERLKNDLAYNQCLAMFGPAARNVAGTATPGAPASPVAAAATVAIPQAEEPELTTRPGRRGGYRARRGRQSVAFAVGEGRSFRYRRRR